MIPISDLRKGNLIKTEYGILPVHALIFNEVQVKGKDGRILWAKEIEGIGIGEIDIYKVGESLVSLVLRKWVFVHEMQNWYYWHSGKELELNLGKNMDGFDILIDSMKRTGAAHTEIMNDIKKRFNL